jgi:hypothetical protein
MAAARVVHLTMYAQFEARNPHALHVLEHQQHVTVLPFPPAVLSALRQITDQVLQDKAARSPQFQRICTDYQQFRQLHDAWSAKADDSYQNGLTCGAQVQYYEQRLREALAPISLVTIAAQSTRVTSRRADRSGRERPWPVGTRAARPDLPMAEQPEREPGAVSAVRRWVERRCAYDSALCKALTRSVASQGNSGRPKWP